MALIVFFLSSSGVGAVSWPNNKKLCLDFDFKNSLDVKSFSNSSGNDSGITWTRVVNFPLFC